MKNKITENQTDNVQSETQARKITRRDLLRAGGTLAAAGVGTLAADSAIARHSKKSKSSKTEVTGNYFPQRHFHPDIDIAGKTAVITGASRGIGRAAAEALVARGVNVIGTSRDITTMPGGGAAGVDYRNLDITDSTSINAFIGGLTPSVDILINNAGRFVVGATTPLPTTQIGFYMDAMNLGMQTNYLGHVELTQKMLGYMSALATGSDYSRILFTVSGIGYTVGGTDHGYDLNGASFFHNYTAGKRSTLAFANSLRATLRRSTFPPLNNIKVTTINPVAINTDLDGEDRMIFTDSDITAYAPLLALLHAAFDVAVPAELVGEAYAQLVSMNDPDPNVAAGSENKALALAGRNENVEEQMRLENEEAGFRIVRGK